MCIYVCSYMAKVILLLAEVTDTKNLVGDIFHHLMHLVLFINSYCSV